MNVQQSLRDARKGTTVAGTTDVTRMLADLATKVRRQEGILKKMDQ